MTVYFFTRLDIIVTSLVLQFLKLLVGAAYFVLGVATTLAVVFNAL